MSLVCSAPLACYGDDATTPDQVEGAKPGDAITFLVDGWPTEAQPLRFNGAGVPRTEPIRWTAQGDRWEAALGQPQLPDLAVAKAVVPTVAGPGEKITYTLTYSNTGSGLARSVRIADTLPSEILDLSFAAAGASLARDEGAPPFAWQVGDLDPGAGGTITITGIISPALTSQAPITNTAVIRATGDALPANNVAEAALQVDLPPSIAAEPAAVAAQYSDARPEVTISGTDVAGETLAITTTWRGPGQDATPSLPDRLALTDAGCSEDGGQPSVGQVVGDSRIEAMRVLGGGPTGVNGSPAQLNSSVSL